MLYQVIQAAASGRAISPYNILMQILAVAFIIFCILPLHEFAHGWMAQRLGDNTAKLQGRLTLNPLASLDPMGALMILLFGFGWAKPVPVDPRYFKNPKKGMALTALAGPVANILAALAGALILNILAFFGVSHVLVLIFFTYYIRINVMLAVFNLLPVPPLDGSRIVAAFLPDRMMWQYYRYQRQIVLVLFLLLFLGVLDRPLAVVDNLVESAVYWVASLPFRFWI